MQVPTSTESIAFETDYCIVTTMEVVIMATVAAGQAKAHFLELLRDVEMKRETVIVTKHGREVAKLVPMELAKDVDPLDRFLFPGKIVITGDIMAPLYTDEELDEFERNSVEQLHDRS